MLLHTRSSARFRAIRIRTKRRLSPIRRMLRPFQRYARWLRHSVAGRNGVCGCPRSTIWRQLQRSRRAQDRRRPHGHTTAQARCETIRGPGGPRSSWPTARSRPQDVANRRRAYRDLIDRRCGGLRNGRGTRRSRAAGICAITIFEAKRPFQTIADFPEGKADLHLPHRDDARTATCSSSTNGQGRTSSRKCRSRHGSIEVVRDERVSTESIRQRGLLRTRAGQRAEQRSEALRVIVAIGRSGNFRKLGDSGWGSGQGAQSAPRSARLSRDARSLVVGGGDSARLEVGDCAMAQCVAQMSRSPTVASLSSRDPSRRIVTSASPRWCENPGRRRRHRWAERPIAWQPPAGQLVAEKERRAGRASDIELNSTNPEEITAEPERASFNRADTAADLAMRQRMSCSAMIGREAPLDFFRRCRSARSAGEWNWRGLEWIAVVGCAFLAIFAATMTGSQDGFLWSVAGRSQVGLGLFPTTCTAFIAGLGDWAATVSREIDRRSVLHDFGRVRMKSAAAFTTRWLYTLLVVGIFGMATDQAKTERPTWRVQTTWPCLPMQLLPLFLLPELILAVAGLQRSVRCGLDAGSFARHAIREIHPRIPVPGRPMAGVGTSDAPTGDPTAWSWPGRSPSTTSSRTQPQTAWLVIAFIADVRADPGHRSGAGVRAPTVVGSAPAGRWPRRSGTPTGTRCLTDRSGTGWTWPAKSSWPSRWHGFENIESRWIRSSESRWSK